MVDKLNSLGKTKINSLLPPEILEMILGLLSPADLRSAVLVCQLWREVGEAPGLWTWVLPRATREKRASAVAVLASRRMR